MMTYSYGIFSSWLIRRHLAPSILDTSRLSSLGCCWAKSFRYSTENRIKPFLGLLNPEKPIETNIICLKTTTITGTY